MLKKLHINNYILVSVCLYVAYIVTAIPWNSRTLQFATLLNAWSSQAVAYVPDLDMNAQWSNFE